MAHHFPGFLSIGLKGSVNLGSFWSRVCGTVPGRAATSIGLDVFGWNAPWSDPKGPVGGIMGGIPETAGG